MNFKIDTKQKFYVIEPELTQLTANMAEQLSIKLLQLANTEPYNIIIKLTNISNITMEACEILVNCRDSINQQNHSMVCCNVTDTVLEQIIAFEMEEALNITPTESEAWDIVQMDEIEREFDF